MRRKEVKRSKEICQNLLKKKHNNNNNSTTMTSAHLRSDDGQEISDDCDLLVSSLTPWSSSYFMIGFGHSFSPLSRKSFSVAAI